MSATMPQTTLRGRAGEHGWLAFGVTLVLQ
jgi:hypothetical protein